jgi:hypothetical protein
MPVLRRCFWGAAVEATVSDQSARPAGCLSRFKIFASKFELIHLTIELLRTPSETASLQFEDEQFQIFQDVAGRPAPPQSAAGAAMCSRRATISPASPAAARAAAPEIAIPSL